MYLVLRLTWWRIAPNARCRGRVYLRRRTKNSDQQKLIAVKTIRLLCLRRLARLSATELRGGFVEEAEHEEQNHGTNRSANNLVHKRYVWNQAEASKQVAEDRRSNDTNDNVWNETQAAAFHKVASKETANCTDDYREHQPTYVHAEKYHVHLK